MAVCSGYNEDRAGAFSLLVVFGSGGYKRVVSYVIFDFSKITLYRSFDSVNI